MLGVQPMSKPRKIHLLHTHTYGTLVGLRTCSTIPYIREESVLGGLMLGRASGVRDNLSESVVPYGFQGGTYTGQLPRRTSSRNHFSTFMKNGR